ncbi:hypothetical protein FCG40_02690 [Fimbriimonadia bacterium ATM]|nr:hypothetical protein [Fimbriimonadia bacterium ATM]
MDDHGTNPEASQNIRAVEDSFVREWGVMSSRWGIAPTVARIHALMFLAGQPFTPEELMERIRAPKDEVLQSLSVLVDWGVVKKKGEEPEPVAYFTDMDAIQTIAQVVRQRKHRELDPTVSAIEGCLGQLGEADADPKAQAVKRRLTELLDVFDFLDMAYQFAFASDSTFRKLVTKRREIRAMLQSAMPGEGA